MKALTAEALLKLLIHRGWQIHDTHELPGRMARTASGEWVSLAPPARRLIASFPSGLYQHQLTAIAAALDGRDVIMTTGTASGKTLAYQAVALDCIGREVNSRVMVLYPLKALAREQEDRWREACEIAAAHCMVGRIDGSVERVSDRERILGTCRIVVFTPDVVHAWLLSNLRRSAIRSFLAQVRLIVLDEVHTYSGIFGSNAAFLFRRLLHAISVLSKTQSRPRFFAASATMADPADHLQRLCGAVPVVIGPDQESSPRAPVTLILASPNPAKDASSEIGSLIRALADQGEARFLVFADSRRQVESLAVIATRGLNEMEPADEGELEEGEEVQAPGLEEGLVEVGRHRDVLPYRAGYEEADRAKIQEWLRKGNLKGVISTSALELGIDIGDLDVGVQVGIPPSVNTLLQRMGRIGRRQPGTFLVIPGSLSLDREVVKNPRLLLQRPLAPSTVYLQNRRIQYIHTMCLAGPGGEADALGLGESWEGPSDSDPLWPEGFAALCRSERQGNVPPDLQALKIDAGDDPWHAFPLRAVESQFKIERRIAAGTEREPLGEISYSQMLREAYPGAIYYYMAKPYRVIRLSTTHRLITVRRAKHYTTRPLAYPPLISPVTSEPAICSRRVGSLHIIEGQLQVAEAIRGYEEIRGRTKRIVTYPCPYWPRDILRRLFFTTGVLLILETWPSAGLDWAAVALYSGFQLAVPIESSEVSAGSGRIRGAGPHGREIAFLALYDRVYGSLRLTSAAMDMESLRAILAAGLEALKLATDENAPLASRLSLPYIPSDVGSARQILETLLQELGREPMDLPPPGWPWLPAPEAEVAAAAESASQEELPIVIVPGSSGQLAFGAEEEFVVEDVRYTPNGLIYRGHRVGESDASEVTTYLPVDRVRPIAGLSRLGRFDPATGEVKPIG